MVKFNLNEQGFVIKEKITKKYIITILWVIFTVLLITCAFLLLFTIGRLVRADNGNGLMSFETNPQSIPLYFFELVFFVFLYFGLKFIVTFWFCSDKYNSIQLKLLEDNNFPVCNCKEALKVWQTVVIYLIPVITIYTMMFLISVTINGEMFESIEIGFMTMLFFISFFMAFDLTLVAYVLFIKIKDKIDYIAIDHHVYKMTLYKETYLKIGGKNIKNKIIPKEDKSPKRMFTKITTCLNPECENYTQKLEKNTKVCSLCGGHTYISEVLENVVTCKNKNCENYGKELKKEVEICELCGEKTKNFAFDFNPRLTMPAIVTAISATIIFPFIYLYMINYSISGPIGEILFIVRTVIILASIFMGFLSKNKAAIIITIISLPLSNIFINYISSMF